MIEDDDGGGEGDDLDNGELDARALGIGSRIESHGRRRAQARQESASRVWARVAVIGTLGWSVSLPPVGGALLGHWIDRKLGGGVVFALLGLLLGAVAGAYALWRLWGDVNER